MTAGMKCLLSMLRNQQPACATESEWLDLLAVSQEENLLPWVAACLSSLQNQLPVSVREQVLEICRQARHQAFIWSATLKHLLSVFHERDIAVISLKGPWLAERLYGNTALRAYSDLDFLVRPCDWNAVEHTLSELGFSPCKPADERHRLWQRGAIYVEPHFRLASPMELDLDTDDIWSRARFSEFHGAPGWLLAPSDELLFLCVHAFRHCFERLSLALDLNFAFRKLPAPDMSYYGRLGSELKNALVFSWILAARACNLPSLPAPSDAWLARNPHLEKIANRVWERRMLHTTTSSFKWFIVHRFYVQMNVPGWPHIPGRIRYARILLNRVTGKDSLGKHDYDFAARFHLYRSWQVRMLRPVGLVIQAARHSRLIAKRYRHSSLLPNSIGSIRSSPTQGKEQAHDSFHATAQYSTRANL